MCVLRFHPPQRPQTSLQGSSPPHASHQHCWMSALPVLSQPWGGGAANLTAMAKMEIRMYVHAGWEEGAGRGEKVAALAPWRDEKPSKPREEENTGRAKVKLPRPSEREQGKYTKLFLPSGRLCMWSNRRPGVETLSYCI